MGFLDSIVGRSFRDEKAGRVVVFNGDRPGRGYLVKSEADEIRIRSFLKMFYYADFAITLLGGQVAIAWSMFFSNLQGLGDPAAHLLRTGGIYLGINAFVVGLPFFLLWRSYKKALLNFVSAQEEVLVSGRGAGGQPWIGLAALCVLVLAALLIFFLIRAK
jgi:hypothetical protein